MERNFTGRDIYIRAGWKRKSNRWRCKVCSTSWNNYRCFIYEGAATASGITKDITIELPTYEKVGVYEYTLHEVNRNNAGVTYYENNIKLVVTVIQGENGKLRIAAVHTEAANGEKSDTFENTYSANSLPVKKL